MPAPRKTCVAPIASAAPQLPQVAIAVVISTANTSCSNPATAFPSSISGSISASRWSEAFGLDRLRVVSEADERLGHVLDERRRPADVDQWALGGARADLGQHLRVDPAGVARPAGRLRPRQRVDDREAVTGAPLELVAIDDVVPAARGQEETR